MCGWVGGWGGEGGIGIYGCCVHGFILLVGCSICLGVGSRRDSGMYNLVGFCVRL